MKSKWMDPASESLRKFLAAGAGAFALAGLLTASAQSGTLDDVIERGKLVAGVKADYAPWGMRDSDGNIVGMEIDMIRDLAQRIGEAAERKSSLNWSLSSRPTACSSWSRARSTS